jgi:hypothetical protein
MNSLELVMHTGKLFRLEHTVTCATDQTQDQPNSTVVNQDMTLPRPASDEGSEELAPLSSRFWTTR